MGTLLRQFRKAIGIELEPAAGEVPVPVFILGAMRSGTTFLVDKLTQHPQLLKVGNELRSVWTHAAGAPCEEGGACPRVDEMHFSAEAAQRMGLYFAEYLRASRRPAWYLQRLDQWRKNRQGRLDYDWDRVRPVNKSTHLMNKVGYVQALFPQAHFIIIVRSIEGQVASFKRFVERQHARQGRRFVLPADGESCWTIYEKGQKVPAEEQDRQFPGHFRVLPEAWIRLNHQALTDALRYVPAQQLTLLSYEELVQNQPRVMAAVFGRLSLADAHRNTVEKIIHRPHPIYNTHTQGHPLEKWKQDLSQEELGIIANVKQEQAAAYQAIQQHLSLPLF